MTNIDDDVEREMDEYRVTVGQIYEEGRRAGRSNVLASECPYEPPSWQADIWLEARKESADMKCAMTEPLRFPV